MTWSARDRASCFHQWIDSFSLVEWFLCILSILSPNSWFFWSNRMLIDLIFVSIFIAAIDEIRKASRIFLNALFCSFWSLFWNCFCFFIKFLIRSLILRLRKSYRVVDLSLTIILVRCFAIDWLNAWFALHLLLFYSHVLWTWAFCRCKFLIIWRFFETLMWFHFKALLWLSSFLFELEMNHFWFWIIEFDHVFSCSVKSFRNCLTQTFTVDFNLF